MQLVINTTTHNRYFGEKTPRKRGFFVRNSGRSGFTLTEIMIVVTILALLTTVAIPSFMQYIADARTRLCLNNLRMIMHAKEIVTIGNSLNTGDICPVATVNTYIDDGIPICPEAGVYTYGLVGIPPTCSYGGFHGL